MANESFLHTPGYPKMMEAASSKVANFRAPVASSEPGDTGRAHPRVLRHASERRNSQPLFKDQNLSHVSHELLQPITAIYQFVTILLDHVAGELNVEQQQYLDIVLRNVKQLGSMVDDLLEGTRVQTDSVRIDPQGTSVRDAIAYAMATLKGAAASKSIALSSCATDDAAFVYADPARLRQMLLIVVDNAIKFTPVGGTVHIGALVHAEDPAVMVLEVADSGCGINPEMADRIFERLVQGSDLGNSGRQGLGLGLYICKDLVLRHGGKISARNAPGTGTVLSISLPRFSLSNLLAPAFKRKGNPQRPVSLVVTELRSETGWRPDDLRAEHSQEVRALLQGCLQSDEEVLLPKMSSDGTGERFFIVAGHDGAAALASRIRDQLAMRDYMRQASLTLSTRCQLLEPISGVAENNPESMLERAVLGIQQLVDGKTSRRMSGHEQ
jgi:nitrogen-specific signal transduction histidine kinase